MITEREQHLGEAEQISLHTFQVQEEEVVYKNEPMSSCLTKSECWLEKKGLANGVRLT